MYIDEGTNKLFKNQNQSQAELQLTYTFNKAKIIVRHFVELAQAHILGREVVYWNRGANI
jgi:hypothetical protein